MTDSELVQRVVRDVATATGNDPLDIFNADKRKYVAQGRAIACWILRAVGGYSYPVLGRHFDKDHATILKAVQRAGRAIKDDRSWRFLIGRDMTWLSVKAVTDSVMVGLNGHAKKNIDNPQANGTIPGNDPTGGSAITE